eukprot:10641108-Prorocentrum_lima.AAC.1
MHRTCKLLQGVGLTKYGTVPLGIEGPQLRLNSTALSDHRPRDGEVLARFLPCSAFAEDRQWCKAST